MSPALTRPLALQPAETSSPRLLSALVLSSLVALLGLPGSQALSQPGDAYVVQVHHDPISPAPDQPFNMSLTLKPDLELKWVKVFVCSITEGFCGAPVPAEPLAGQNHTYGNASFIESKEGHTLGYKFLFKTTNDTFYKYPSENTTYPGLEIVELMETPYFKVQIQGNYTPPPPEEKAAEGVLAAPGTLGMLVSLLTASYLVGRGKFKEP